MPDNANDPQSFSQFLDFINNGLDLSSLDAAPRRLTEDEIEQLVMPMIRDDIVQETLRAVDKLVRNPGRDHWRAQLAPLHREIRECLANTIGGMLARRYPERLNADEWADVATFVITVAWLVRKQIDSDDPPPSDN